MKKSHLLPYMLQISVKPLNEMNEEDFHGLYPKHSIEQKRKILKLENSVTGAIQRTPSSLILKNERQLQGHVQYFGMRIDWSYSNKMLSQYFNIWLLQNRPIKGKSQTGKSQAKKSFANLKALGAYRLLKTMTAQEASDYVSKITNGAQLFKNLADWYLARKRAENLLKSGLISFQ